MEWNKFTIGSLNAFGRYESACTAYSQRANDIVQLLKRLCTLHSGIPTIMNSANCDKYPTLYRV
ncbi:Isoleucyl-tRNA synthetase [Giardia duodenalis assemblage B]|uniref:Isoleucyl-tRNA synthetase n=1 Tax=Giardia duodenalis assemblage B TaxID=1394984 RepID=A0A132NXQ7_GIAIN|nr:Isoleucyl-tRNA synthetase [Giardia intestinalis assemblage B]